MASKPLPPVSSGPRKQQCCIADDDINKDGMDVKEEGVIEVTNPLPLGLQAQASHQEELGGQRGGQGGGTLG
ncbi:hypothetical protein E2562_033883 [Oryza meyeriana var. granulata]|uniref:Uncharacterized protein n=1 Tax=Oryza meyeriana var. granulata TaxID=110450 RepID=A0A6G1CKH6_9ORYZ|nr:hypothetical protein E2562_033883 [Oryza meyeriana var. granulata]